LEKEALQTAPATLPFAMEVNAIEDCTVDGKKHINRKPQYNCCPKIGSNTGLASNPITGKITKVKAKTKACIFQCSIPSSTASRDNFAPCKKKSMAIATVVSILK